MLQLLVSTHVIGVLPYIAYLWCYTTHYIYYIQTASNFIQVFVCELAFQSIRNWENCSRCGYYVHVYYIYWRHNAGRSTFIYYIKLSFIPIIVNVNHYYTHLTLNILFIYKFVTLSNLLFLLIGYFGLFCILKTLSD